MNRRGLLSFIGVMLLLISCKKDCRDKQYRTYIALVNKTGYELAGQLFPKQEFLVSDVFYKASDVGGGVFRKEFVMDSNVVAMYSFDGTLYSSIDTTWSPNDLLAHVFDSIYIHVSDTSQTEIKILHDTTINLTVNPFKDSSVWSFKLLDTSQPTNDCENKVEIKSYRFYLEKEYIPSLYKDVSNRFVR